MKTVILTAASGMLLSLLIAEVPAADPTPVIVLDAASPGRVFEGVGGVSAGASSRLLFDYPEPQRSEILDDLFKPRYGASLQHLKVEIGGDVNSTDGVEPSHMHSRNDENYTRGYEWWLMKEAKKRNPDIVLDCLAWGAPAWIGNGTFYSQDMADYVVKFIKGAKQFHGLDINFTGIWNEKPYDVAWIKLLRKTLDSSGLAHVGIIVADQCADVWKIADQINHDPELKGATFAIGVHYPRCQSTMAATGSGMRLWSSEDGPWSGEWNAAATGSQTPLQVTINRNYIVGKMTKTEIWSPISSYYDNLPLPGSGLMRANTPWSGHFEIQPALWVAAHTTQFARPGWKYLDSACRLLPGTGSVVALQAPKGSDYSMIIETSDATVSKTLAFQLKGGLSASTVHVWRTNGREHFQRLVDITPMDRAFTVTVDPKSVYSLTTTTGQQKGGATPPPRAPFPLHYEEDFAGDAPGATPKYWSDIAGVFEVVRRTDAKGNALRQVIDKKGIEWRPNPFPESICGDVNWEDYTLSADALIENAGFVSLLGRIAAEDALYRLNITDHGDWELLAGTAKLRGGKVPFSANTWHNLKLAFQDDEISVAIDGSQVARVQDSSVDHGNAGIGCGWHPAQFANIAIHSQPPREDLARGKPATASSQWSEEYPASKVNDGDFNSRWNAADGKSTGEWLEIDLGRPTSFDRTLIRQFDNRITRYKIQYWNGSAWRDAVSGGPMAAVQRDQFSAVSGSKLRLLVLETRGGQTPSVFSIGCYRSDVGR
jgi:Glycosyl hydrolase family 59/F5/8 type C domain/Galactocerebrosidase, C-terminal lectin domain